MNPNWPLLLGHRGASLYAPENTLRAFELALAHACDGFEFDVRLTADGDAVCCHDPILEHAPPGLLPLEYALDFSPRAFLNIELKVAGVVSRFRKSLSALAPERTAITSFLPEVVEEIAAHLPHIPAGLICRNEQQFAELRRVHASVVALHHSLISAERLAMLSRLNKRVFAWTVNDPAAMLRFAEMGVDAIISDDTLVMAQTFQPVTLSAVAR